MSNEDEMALLRRRVDILEQKVEATSSLLTWIIISLMIIRLFSYIVYIPKKYKKNSKNYILSFFLVSLFWSV